MYRWLGVVGCLLGATAGAQNVQACGGTPGLPAWVQAGVYSGTLGSSTVTLGLSPRNIDANRYFYAGRAADLFLTPFRSGNTLILQEEVRLDYGAETTVSGCLTLERDGTALRGTWKVPGTARTLKVTLEAMNVAKVALKLPASPGLTRLRRSDPLTFLKLNRPWTNTADGRRTREPLSGLSYPRVPGASPALELVLQDRLLEHAAAGLNCKSWLPQRAQGDDGYTLNVGVTLLTSRLLSLREDVGYSCGGAHPDSSTTGLILDRATGRHIPLQTLWPSLTPARLKTLYLALPGTEPDSECDDILHGMEPSFAVYLTPAGLNLTPDSLPHVIAACAETVMVPYGQLRTGANRASPYYPELYGR
ncbi:hypothetical protein [Deinococcus aerophilus]|uniref:Uncharacterized protein n=1 Tax=Deinococcus aerophilus TaxID=522488 RepID=A0ABQ2GI68_9DEIO|nr:hypothetical protein [Deinococcus aerophilus]GGL97617.1 hypothetical protein GCM10010841_02470 [Deinococcus aerophilus]